MLDRSECCAMPGQLGNGGLCRESGQGQPCQQNCAILDMAVLCVVGRPGNVDSKEGYMSSQCASSYLSSYLEKSPLLYVSLLLAYELCLRCLLCSHGI